MDRVRPAGGRVARLSAAAGCSNRGCEVPCPGVGGRLDNLPGNPTGGVVDPMTTKLEMMVGYLAGRQGKAAESIRRELEDPTSEASRWLEVMRRRTRRKSPRSSLTTARQPSSSDSVRNGVTIQKPGPKRLLPFLSGVSAASLVFLAIGLAGEHRITGFTAWKQCWPTRDARWEIALSNSTSLHATKKAPQGNATSLEATDLLLSQSRRPLPTDQQFWHWLGSRPGSGRSENASGKRSRARTRATQDRRAANGRGAAQE